MKKISAVLLSALLCLCMFGCSNTHNIIASSDETQIASSLQPEESDSNISENASTSNNPTQNNQSSEVQKGSTSQKEKTTQKTQDQSKTQEKTTAKTAEKNNKKQNQTKSTTTTTSAYITCTVTIECKKVLNNMDKLKAGHEEYVPSDGYMINSQSVTVKNGSSAYDAVKTACSQNSVTINSTGSSYGIYIAGFNNIDEKDCGKTSGWLYYVNAKQPQQSCGRYTVKNGDSIVFSYTC